MPQIGWLEILFVVIIAILVLGPKEFPIALKKIGSYIGKLKNTLASFQREVSSATQNIDLEEVKTNKKTKKNIITRELSFKQGQEFDKEKILSIINEDKRKIINTNLFNEVNINIRLLPNNKESQKADIDIDVIESFYWIPSILYELHSYKIDKVISFI